MAEHRQFIDVENPAFTAVHGGKGGFAFDDVLVDGDQIRALWIAAGSLIDSIQIAYRNGHRTSRHGGIGGAGQWHDFAPEERVLSLGGRSATHVEQLLIRTTHRVIAAGNAHSTATPFLITAPDGHHLIGFHGRCGQYVDAIGARLAPVPAPRHLPAERARAELCRMPHVHFVPFRERSAD